MGEYAIRKSDNDCIKIGTCEDMYYLRYEDQDKVTPDSFQLSSFLIDFNYDHPCASPKLAHVLSCFPSSES